MCPAETLREYALDDGEYVADITRVEVQHLDTGPHYRVEAAVVAPGQPHDGVSASTLIKREPWRGSRLTEFYETVMGETVQSGECLCPEDMVGARVQARIENRRGSNGKVYRRIIWARRVDTRQKLPAV